MGTIKQISHDDTKAPDFSIHRLLESLADTLGQRQYCLKDGLEH